MNKYDVDAIIEWWDSTSLYVKLVRLRSADGVDLKWLIRIQTSCDKKTRFEKYMQIQ